MVPHCVLRIHVNQHCISLCIFKKQTDVHYAILISVKITNFLFFLVIYSSIFFHFQEEIELCQTYFIIYRDDYGRISLHGFIYVMHM